MHSAIQRLINLQWVQCLWHISAKFKCLCSNVNLVVRPKSLKWKCVVFFSSLLNYELWWLYPCIFLSRWGPACSSGKSHGLCWYFPVRQFPKQQIRYQTVCLAPLHADWELPLLDKWHCHSKRKPSHFLSSFYIFKRFWGKEFWCPPKPKENNLQLFIIRDSTW